MLIKYYTNYIYNEKLHDRNSLHESNSSPFHSTGINILPY